MPKKVLVADDEPDILQVIQYRLSKKGYEVILAANGQEALEKIYQHKPDLIFLDFQMPIVDGVELCRRIKADPVLKKIPVIILSASLYAVGDKELAQVNANGRIIKPFEPDELYRIVDKFLN